MKARLFHRTSARIAIAMALAGLCASGAHAAEPVSEGVFRANNSWMLLATFLVFIMHPGFATLEAGLTQAKNTANIFCTHTIIMAIGLLTYYAMGFSLMYGETVNQIVGWAGFGLSLPGGGTTAAYANGNMTYWTDFLFQAMFAATTAAIVSGALVERVKLPSFLIFAAIYLAVIYPLTGHWIWGSGWLKNKGFHDFAGCTAVHSVGGWAALAGIMVLGPRTGKYVNGKSRGVPGHSIPLAAIGVFLLWFGWFGFNGGSVLSADPGAVSRVCVTTSMGAAAGVILAMFTSWIVQNKPDVTMVLNGALAGLVGITASADVITPGQAIIIGGVAGILVVLGVLFIDGVLHLDDPVGATSVHLVCGIWGTVATGIFGTYDGKSLLVQLIGIAVVGVVSFVSSLVLFLAIKAVLGIRVPEAEEMRGLDIGEHGMEAYSGFQIFTSQ